MLIKNPVIVSIEKSHSFCLFNPVFVYWKNPKLFVNLIRSLSIKKIHSFCDLYEAARHSYKPFQQLELDSYVEALDTLKSQVIKWELWRSCKNRKKNLMKLETQNLSE